MAKSKGAAKGGKGLKGGTVAAPKAKKRGKIAVGAKVSGK